MKNVNLLAKLFLSFFDNIRSNRLKKTRKKTNTKGLRKMSFIKQLVKVLFCQRTQGLLKYAFDSFHNTSCLCRLVRIKSKTRWSYEETPPRPQLASVTVCFPAQCSTEPVLVGSPYQPVQTAHYLLHPHLFQLKDHTSPYWLHYGWCSPLFSFFDIFQVQMRVTCYLITKVNSQFNKRRISVITIKIKL